MKLWSVNFLQKWPIDIITAKKSMQEKSHKTDQTTMLTPLNKNASYTFKGLKGDEIMTVNELIKEFIKPHTHSFKLKGPYGYITMIPEHHFPLINALLEQIFAQFFWFRALVCLKRIRNALFT